MTTHHSQGKQPARIPVDPDLRDRLQEEKRGKENWTEVLKRIYTEWLEYKERERSP